MGEQPAVTLVALRAPRGRRSWTIKHNGCRYAVFVVDGELEVTDAACPHNGGPLARGMIRDGVVTCPWHWYRFELISGRCLTWSGFCLRKYPVISRDGRSYAELPGAERWPWWRQLLGVAARPGRPAGPSGRGTPASGTPASGTPASGTPASGTPASGMPASGTQASGTPG